MEALKFHVRPMQNGDIAGAVALQRACFPPPFLKGLLWTEAHLAAHCRLFRAGQFVVEAQAKIVGSASALLLAEPHWQAHLDWEKTVGGHFFRAHDPAGTTLYGADISVHPDFRGRGLGRALYRARFGLVRELGLVRFGTACRLPGFSAWKETNMGEPSDYAAAVLEGRAEDRTLSPLLRSGLRYLGTIHNHMEDQESGNAAAVLEWKP